MAADPSQKKALRGDPEVNPSSAWAPGSHRRGWLLFLLLVTAPLAVIVADSVLRARHAHRSAASWIGALDLSSPALWPSGTAQRHPELFGPGRDVRFSPWLPLSPVDHSGRSFLEGSDQKGET